MLLQRCVEAYPYRSPGSSIHHLVMAGVGEGMVIDRSLNRVDPQNRGLGSTTVGSKVLPALGPDGLRSGQVSSHTNVASISSANLFALFASQNIGCDH